MRQDELDRILSGEAEVVPSSGFALSVMEAVCREAATPPPIPFPWKRAVLGLCACGLALGFALIVGTTAFLGGISSRPALLNLPTGFAAIVDGWNTVHASWIALGLILSFTSVKLSMRFRTRIHRML